MTKVIHIQHICTTYERERESSSGLYVPMLDYNQHTLLEILGNTLPEQIKPSAATYVTFPAVCWNHLKLLIAAHTRLVSTLGMIFIHVLQCLRMVSGTPSIKT